MNSKSEINFFFHLTEPIGSSAPKRASLTESQLTPQLLDETCLVCPVQGSPVPYLRLGNIWLLDCATEENAAWCAGRCDVWLV